VSTLRILAFDHFFDQDLAALRSALSAGEELFVMPYQRLYRLARRHFPDRAFEGLDAALDVPAARWASYRAAVERTAEWWAGAYRPSVFVAPTDAIFYLRPMIERLAQLDVKTVVVQKETSISPMVMAQHSAAVARTVPFLSAAMTVCSTRNRDFWVRSGTPPEVIVVTGQPRFDVYARAETESSDRGATPHLLYLSYDDLAYLPSDVGMPYAGTWRELRRETEQAIAAAAESGSWSVTVKRHPQQRAGDNWLGSGTREAPRDADTRQLIMSADAVIGFQTTAVYEAVLAGKPVLYPAWGAVFESARSLLLPFHEDPGLVTLLRAPAELAAALAQSPDELAAPTTSGRALAESQLGPVDGRASARVLDVLRRHSGPGPAEVAAPRPSRIARATMLGACAPGLRAAGALAVRLGRPVEGAAAIRRAGHWTELCTEARAFKHRR